LEIFHFSVENFKSSIDLGCFCSNRVRCDQ
jgi:hypothetical protein